MTLLSSRISRALLLVSCSALAAGAAQAADAPVAATAAAGDEQLSAVVITLS